MIHPAYEASSYRGVLEATITKTGAELVERNGSFYYKVTGSSGLEYLIRVPDLNTYIVGETSPRYVSIVTPRGHSYTEVDALVALLHGLHNDLVTSKYIPTLTSIVNEYLETGHRCSYRGNKGQS